MAVEDDGVLTKISPWSRAGWSLKQWEPLK